MNDVAHGLSYSSGLSWLQSVHSRHWSRWASCWRPTPDSCRMYRPSFPVHCLRTCCPSGLPFMIPFSRNSAGQAFPVLFASHQHCLVVPGNQLQSSLWWSLGSSGLQDILEMSLKRCQTQSLTIDLVAVRIMIGE